MSRLKPADLPRHRAPRIPRRISRGMETFNLIDEPWIPVILTDGRPARVGLRGLFAPDVREVACSVPSQTMAVIRLATAIA